tara:strand:- start:335 stop:502 length:168 start_codon:yes stop_codon:yes gene_type:complete
MSNDPEYVESKRSYMKRVATRCRICKGQLLDPTEAKKEMHDKCVKEYKSKTKGLR